MLRCCRGRWRERARKLWTPANLGSAYRVCFDAKDRAGQVITSDTSIDTWKDLLRNGLDVTPVSTKPTVVGNVFNGHPCVRFSSSPMNSASNIVTGSTYSVLCLVKDNSASAVIQEPFSIGTSNSVTSFEFLLDYDGTTGTNRFSFQNLTVRAKTTANYSDSPALLAMGLSGGVSKIRANGANGTDVGSSISTATSVFRVGGSRPQNKYPLNGDLYCVLVIASPIGSLDYFKAEGWMAWNYSAPYLLGAAHPYKLRPPLEGD